MLRPNNERSGQSVRAQFDLPKLLIRIIGKNLGGLATKLASRLLQHRICEISQAQLLLLFPQLGHPPPELMFHIASDICH